MTMPQKHRRTPWRHSARPWMQASVSSDIQLTKDRIPVVFHDFTLKRVCGGEGKISDYTEELQQFHCDSVGEDSEV